MNISDLVCLRLFIGDNGWTDETNIFITSKYNILFFTCSTLSVNYIYFEILRQDRRKVIIVQFQTNYFELIKINLFVCKSKTVIKWTNIITHWLSAKVNIMKMSLECSLGGFRFSFVVYFFVYRSVYVLFMWVSKIYVIMWKR
jgi:hypothetical protein